MPSDLKPVAARHLMKRQRTERRKNQRHSESFKDIEERDQFIAQRFPILMRGKKAGYFSTPEGVTVSVWMTKVLWTEPLKHASE
jgi:hypothetical protein